jgi:hypothetical protein
MSLPVSALKYCVSLKSLTLLISLGSSIEKDLVSLVEENPMLETICICSPENETYDPIHAISDALLNTIIMTCAHIHTISINNCQNVSLSVIAAVFEKYGNQLTLVEISLVDKNMGCVHYSKFYTSCDEGFDMKLLGEFDADYPQKDWITLFSGAMNKCRLISFVDCSGVSDGVLECLMKHNAHSLKQLIILKCVDIQSEGMIQHMKNVMPELCVTKRSYL